MSEAQDDRTFENGHPDPGQAPPAFPDQPKEIEAGTQIAEVDLLRYQLHAAKVGLAELKRDMYMRELQRAQAELAEEAREMSEFRNKELPEKYSYDAGKYGITDDGYIVPRALMQGNQR